MSNLIDFSTLCMGIWVCSKAFGVFKNIFLIISSNPRFIWLNPVQSSLFIAISVSNLDYIYLNLLYYHVVVCSSQVVHCFEK